MKYMLGIVIALMLPQLSQAAPVEKKAELMGVLPEEYGQVYLLEQRPKSISNWRFSPLYGYEFSNPYVSLNLFSFNLEHSLGSFFWIGAQFNRWWGEATPIAQTLSGVLTSQSGALQVKVPGWGVSAFGTVVPLKGHYSLFGEVPLEAELGVRLGVSQIWATDESRSQSVFWSVRPAFGLTQWLLLQLGFVHEIENPLNSKDSHSRFRVETGFCFQI